MSEPNGKNMTAEADELGMANSRAISLKAAIASAATKSHGEKPIFF